jgi:hypothetical protein
MIEEQFGGDGPCECCGRDPAECICPECPYCYTTGDKQCYEDASHGLKYNREQRIGQAKMRIAMLREQIQDEEMFVAYMESHPEEDPT